MIKRVVFASIFLLFCLQFATFVFADIIKYELTISQQDVNVTGISVPAMTINGAIPGPTLHFKEGDTARVHVHNKMDVETSIHWHGLLVPPGMDGVPFISFPPPLPPIQLLRMNSQSAKAVHIGTTPIQAYRNRRVFTALS